MPPSRRMARDNLEDWSAPDPAIAVAVRERDWFQRNADRTGMADRATGVGLLVAAAATTAAAALQAPPWMSASLAGLTVVLTGIRSQFDWGRTCDASTHAFHEIRAAIHDYLLLTESSRDEQARRRLVQRVDEIVAQETSSWVARRSSQSPPS